jgi:tRNA uridine 5-carbamoylmethylation protein Kti12
MEWNESSYHLMRKICDEQLKRILSTPSKTTTEKETSTSSTQSLPPVVIIDDNMYLRSMRREIYVTCRNMKVPSLTVWIKTDPEIAFQRNQFRNQFQSGNVSTESFQRICTSFQQPDNRFIFDRHSLVVSGDQEFTTER